MTTFARSVLAVLAACSLLAVAAVGVGFSGATLTASSANSSNTFVGAVDWTTPAITPTVVSLTASSAPTAVAPFVRQGATYRLYANVVDTTSGVASVTANLQNLSGAGATAVALVAGTYTVAGVTYNYATAQQTASAVLTEGAKSVAITAADVAGNSGSTTASATVDNTAPTAADIQTVNAAGGTAGHPELGDKIVYTFSEPVDPASILAGWTGAATNVVVRFTNAVPDAVTVWNAANTAQLPLGSVTAGNAYVTATRTYGATGTASSMVLSGSTITVTLGTQSANAATSAVATTLAWTPSAAATDRAANPMSTTARSETGVADVDF